MPRRSVAKAGRLHLVAPRIGSCQPTTFKNLSPSKQRERHEVLNAYLKLIRRPHSFAAILAEPTASSGWNRSMSLILLATFGRFNFWLLLLDPRLVKY
jgi:hypothetical protein